VKVLYRQTASDDVIRQFRYYLVTKSLQRKLFGFGTMSGAPLNLYANILWWDRGIIRAIRSFKVCAHGQLPDLKLFGFITCSTLTLSASLGFCTESATLSAFSNAKEPFSHCTGFSPPWLVKELEARSCSYMSQTASTSTITCVRGIFCSTAKMSIDLRVALSFSRLGDFKTKW
jgi:hypothetical protein